MSRMKSNKTIDKVKEELYGLGKEVSKDDLVSDADVKKESITEQPVKNPVSIKDRFRKIERNHSDSFSNIEPSHPELVLYWAKGDKNVSKRLRMGYEFANPEDVKDFDVVFGYMNAGEGLSPSGRIEYLGHTLMVTSIDIQNQIYKEKQNKRDIRSKTQNFN